MSAFQLCVERASLSPTLLRIIRSRDDITVGYEREKARYFASLHLSPAYVLSLSLALGIVDAMR